MPEQEFGSDGQLHDTEQPKEQPKPSISLYDKGAGSPVDPFEASEPGAAAQLRRFEDEHLGPDAPRFGGQLEKGHGSLFSRLPPEKQKAHAAIEKAAGTEQKLADAHAALLAAEAEHNAALAAAEDASRKGSA